jgi:uncharacterized protein
MKLLLFTDTHGSEKALKDLKKKSKGVDAVVCAGDISIFEENMNKLLSKLNKFNVPIIMIHGNHEEKSNLEKACSKFKNIDFLNDKTKSLDDIVFLGHGGGGFSKRDKEFERAMKNFKGIKGKKFVLVTHAPPYNTKLDELMDGHCGNISITKFIKKFKPDLAICGHIHENDGKKDYIGKTKIINPGYKGRIINV